MPLYGAKHYPERFIELKKSIIGDEAKVTEAWAELLAALKDATKEYASKGPSMIPIIEFDQLETLGKSAFPTYGWFWSWSWSCATRSSWDRAARILSVLSAVPHPDEWQ